MTEINLQTALQIVTNAQKVIISYSQIENEYTATLIFPTQTKYITFSEKDIALFAVDNFPFHVAVHLIKQIK